MKKHSSRIIPYAIACAVSVAVGCEESGIKQKPVFPVEGTFTAGDKPVANAYVTFHPRAAVGAREIPSQARTDSSGMFHLTTYATGDGAPSGDYIVTVYWPDPKHAKQHAAEDDGDSDALPPDLLRGRFASPSMSKLHARVEGKAVTFAPIDLISNDVTQSVEFYLEQ